MITRAQAIAVTYQEFFSEAFEFRGFEIDRYIQFFLEIIPHPHVVVANKEVHGYARIRELGKFSQQAYKSFGNHPPVFIPKIKHIPHEEDLRGIVFYFIEKTDQQFFTCETACVIGNTQVKIGKEIDLFGHNIFFAGRCPLFYFENNI